MTAGSRLGIRGRCKLAISSGVVRTIVGSAGGRSARCTCDESCAGHRRMAGDCVRRVLRIARDCSHNSEGSWREAGTLHKLWI